MSNTFDDLHFIRKDTINVDMKNRETYQKVRFLNKDNVYYGTFYGFVKSNNCELSNVSLSNCTFYDISGNELDISRLPVIIDEVRSDIYTLKDNVFVLSNRVDDIDSDISDMYRKMDNVDREISTINSSLHELSDTVNDMSSMSLSGLDEEKAERIRQDEKILETTRLLSVLLLNEKEDRVSGDILIANNIAYETIQREREIGMLCSNVEMNNESIADIYSTITDITKYKGKLVLSSDYESTETVNGFTRLFVDNGSSSEDTILGNSYYIIDALDKERHYTVNGRKIDDGDILFINTTTTVKGLVDSKVDITDVLDKDVVHKKEFYETSSYLDNRIDTEQNRITVLSDSYVTVTADFDERIDVNENNIDGLSSTVGDKLKTLYVNISGLLSDDMETDYHHLLSSVIEIKNTLGTLYW